MAAVTKVLLTPREADAHDVIARELIPLEPGEVLTVVSAPEALIGVTGAEVHVVQDREQFCARRKDRERFLKAAAEVGRRARAGELTMVKVWLPAHAQKETA